MIPVFIDAIDETTGRVVIQADTAPATLPTTGEDIDGLEDDYVLAAGSILYVLSAQTTYILGTDGTWYEWA